MNGLLSNGERRSRVLVTITPYNVSYQVYLTD